jgi:hypothetical protein
VDEGLPSILAGENLPNEKAPGNGSFSHLQKNHCIAVNLHFTLTILNEPLPNVPANKVFVDNSAEAPPLT